MDKHGYEYHKSIAVQAVFKTSVDKHGQQIALSRRKQGFESPRERQ